MYQIITGECRYLAAKEAGLTEMPCWEQSLEGKDILVRQLIENWQRTDLHPFDLADTLVRLRDQQNRSQKEWPTSPGSRRARFPRSSPS